MKASTYQKTIQVLDVSGFSYQERVCAAAAQGIINRNGPALFLDYGYYDDPDARRTNEVFMDDEFWYGKYRAILGNQDQHNLDYYTKEHGFAGEKVKDLPGLVKEYRSLFKGYVIWDAGLDDTVNIGLMLAAQENLLLVSADMEEWVKQEGLPLIHDLRGRWKDRVELYQWAVDHLFDTCKRGQLACLEPGWKRPEFIDYVVQNRIFTYSLSSTVKGFGSAVLMLLAFGPAKVRELIFGLRLDSPMRKLGLHWMGRKSEEVNLSNRIQRKVDAAPYPTIFGWHTRRDDELAFMLQLSSNGLRLVPSHLAGNFSFHSQVQPLGKFISDPLPEVKLDPRGIYVTFTLSDGDQLMMMNSAELGNWHSPKRGSIPFNWETQPLLVEFAPALFERYTRTKTTKDCLVAGPSGAGYIVPPLCPDFDKYMAETARVCEKAGIRVVTTYVADPPKRVMRQLAKYKGDLLGYLSGYAIVTRAPQVRIGDTLVMANEIPMAANVWDTAEQLLEKVGDKIKNPGNLPRFIGVHLFAYRTSYDDVARFIDLYKNEHIHFVRGDEFLTAAGQYLKRHERQGRMK